MTDTIEPQPYQHYLQALQRQALVYQSCRHCQSAVFYLRHNCPACGSVELQLRDSQGYGTLYSVTRVYDKQGDYNIVLVDLDEGFRMMSTVVDCLEPPIGSRVLARIESPTEGTPRVVFSLDPGACP